MRAISRWHVGQKMVGIDCWPRHLVLIYEFATLLLCPRNLHLSNFPQFLSFLFAKPPNRLDTGVFSTNDNVN
jgi:hypothetical protein